MNSKANQYTDTIERNNYKILRDAILATSGDSSPCNRIVTFNQVHDGFREDCDGLVEAFLQQNNVRINTFASLWKSLGFENLFNGRPTMYEYREAAEKCFEVAGSYIFSPYAQERDDLPYRIAGLYIAYSLYSLCLFKNLPVIRVPPESLAIFHNIRKRCATNGNSDVLYVMRALLYRGVFKFVCTAREYDLNTYVKKPLSYESAYETHSTKLDLKAPILKEVLKPKSEMFEALLIQTQKFSDIKQRRLEMLQASSAKIPELMHFDLEFPKQLLHSLDTLAENTTTKKNNITRNVVVRHLKERTSVVKKRRSEYSIPFFLNEGFIRNESMPLVESISMKSFKNDLRNEDSTTIRKSVKPTENKKSTRKPQKEASEDLPFIF